MVDVKNSLGHQKSSPLYSCGRSSYKGSNSSRYNMNHRYKNIKKNILILYDRTYLRKKK